MAPGWPDQFSSELWKAESQQPQASLDQLVRRVYPGIDGSHVSTYGPRFGDPRAVPVREFFSP